jgi:hypothetical protein
MVRPDPSRGAVAGFRPLIVAALVAAVLQGCALQTLAPDGPQAARELRVRAGDHVRVVTIDRERLSFTVDEVQADRFVGTTLEPRRKETLPAGEVVQVPYERIALIETANLDVAGAAKAAAGAAAVFTVAFGSVLLTGVPVVVVP